MPTPRDLYVQLCYDLCEPGGLQLGILTDDDFIRYLNLTVLDFCNTTGIFRRIFTQTVSAGVSQYTIPDDILRVDMAFLQGNWLPRSTAGGIANAIRDWRRKLGVPVCFHEDSLPIKTLELAPSPNYNGQFIPGASEPDPPHAQYDSFSAVVFLPPNPLLPVTQTPPQHRGLSVIGPWYPAGATMDCEIDAFPDDLFVYILYGILERVFSSDSELRDLQRAAWAHASYQEGVSLCRAITGEPDEDAA